ncbi:nuclear transport factor 2 family protein [Actinoplanes sp. NEAU-A12]|uniref:Nuclear transport factor 2 family protein n=1 Tax=Actinoplanes sandaracinus TaxID=3045177 RepID=A0ABT6WDY9_9ACTN|nr:nuclear transport factor 2 family protein [Actinoplanes sandaracinus]MDI6097949.1 nuclear transport factor 2 family protein [Actinoplanes sandaracinus]
MTPTEIFALMRARWLADQSTFDPAVLAGDVVLEAPFAAPGQPVRTEGKEQVIAYTEAGHASFPVRFGDCRHVTVHVTADPDVIVVEYELVGTHVHTGVTAAAPFIGVLRTRDGKLAHWREYQHTLAIAQVLSA